MSAKLRKIRHRSPKCFGIHSRTVDGKYVTPALAGGRSVGSKQLLPGEYPTLTKNRTRAELLNAAQRSDEPCHA